MNPYASTLVSREDIAEGTTAFHFARPAGFDYAPGQAIDLVLARADGGTDRHTFSIVSAPHEDELVIATRMRDSAFKRALRDLPDGAAVTIEGPSGSLGLHADGARAAVLIAGGIGITPFISMLRHAAHAGLPHPLTLLYSNRRPEDAAFLAELRQLEASHDRFRLVATMTKMRTSSRPWDGPTGTLGAQRIAEATAGLPAPVFYIVGPPAMAEAMRETLEDAGIDDDDIRSEEFFGY